MTDVLIKRELLERIDETAICDGTDATISDDLFTQLVAALAAPRQPEGEEIAWSLRSDVAGCGLVRYMTDRKYQAQTPAIKQWYEPYRCQQCCDAQRAIAELDRKVWEWSSAATAEAHRVDELKAERDTLRQQLAERDAEILEQCRLNGMGAERELKLMTQRDKLAGLLRMVRQDGWYHPLEEHEIAQIDAALDEVDKKS